MKALQKITNTELYIRHVISHRGWTKRAGWTAGWTEKKCPQMHIYIVEAHALSSKSVQPSDLSNHLKEFAGKILLGVFNGNGWTG